MKVPQTPELPPDIDTEEFSRLHKLLIIAAGGNIQTTADLLEVSIPTVYRWMEPRGAPKTRRRWYGLMFRHLLQQYIAIHDTLSRTSPRPHRREEHRKILVELKKNPLTLPPPLIDTGTYRFKAVWEDGTEWTKEELSRAEAWDQVDTHHFTAESQDIKRLVLRHSTGDLFWIWHRGEEFEKPFPELPSQYGDSDD